MRPGAEKLANRTDGFCAAVAGLISLVVYLWTAAPNVTLLDSGEFIAAAHHFGVPHPTAYPVWTFLAWVFQLIVPFGNAAWKINIFSGVTGAMAVALAAGLSHSAVRWIFPAAGRGITVPVCLGFALLLAFSVSMWSQAVIAEVYTLHALLVGIYLTSVYVLIRRPKSDLTLILSFFFLTFAFSNHHLVLALTPLTFIVVLLLRREIFLDLVVSAVMTAVLFYLLFAILSGEAPTLKASLRLAWCGALLLGVVLWIRRLKFHWTLFAYLPVAVGFGLLPYIYLPIASSTNPPMNWGYTSTAEGFYYSFNRSQYAGSLSDQLLRTVGRAMGVNVTRDEPGEEVDVQLLSRARPLREVVRDWTGFFWIKLVESFSLLAIPAFFVTIVAILRFDLKKRVWIYLLNLAFILAAFLQPIVDQAEIDMSGWWLQMPYHTHTNFIFALLCSAGCVQLLLWLRDKWKSSGWVAWLVLALPVLTLWQNADTCSQRDRWFGWQFGYDILNDLPQGAVLFGGTDPGRFVPTYMIFSESSQPPGVKRDPNFDRRDLYIITQNATAEPFYLRYINDHYSAERPAAEGWFQHWLGRDSHYPEKTIILPKVEEMKEIIEAAAEDYEPKDPLDASFFSHSALAEWIFLKNRDDHEFFVEESIPMLWSYDYAVPHGLILKLEKEPVESISPEQIEADLAFWDDYIERLQANPRFAGDYDARRSFSKLRASGGNLYRHHELKEAAVAAYHQAVALWPANADALMSLSILFWEQDKFEEAQQLFRTALQSDPNSRQLLLLYGLALNRQDREIAIAEARQAWQQEPANTDQLLLLLRLLLDAGEPEKAAEVLAEEEALRLADEPEKAEIALAILARQKQEASALALIQALRERNPDSPDALIASARYYLTIKDEEAGFQALREAIQLGGPAIRTRLRQDPALAYLRELENFQDLLLHPTLPLPATPPGLPSGEE